MHIQKQQKLMIATFGKALASIAYDGSASSKGDCPSGTCCKYGRCRRLYSGFSAA